MSSIIKDKSLKNKIFIIGSNGRLAKAILNHYSDHECTCLKRETYKDWFNPKNKSSILDFFKPRVSKNAIIFITSGILNAKENPELIDNVNYHLPWNIINALEGLEVNIVTFGTILENLKTSKNLYVKSKIKLSNKIDTFKSKSTKVTHFRIHTLYGYGFPSEFMFLGQLYNAIKQKEKFKMSSGYQIREYHHLDDVAKSIEIILLKNKKGIVELTSGNGIRLRDLALRIFEEFNLEHLLNIGSLDIEHKDKFTNDYVKNEDLKDVEFRDPLKGVCDYLKPIL